MLLASQKMEINSIVIFLLSDILKKYFEIQIVEKKLHWILLYFSQLKSSMLLFKSLIILEEKLMESETFLAFYDGTTVLLMYFQAKK